VKIFLKKGENEAVLLFRVGQNTCNLDWPLQIRSSLFVADTLMLPPALVGRG
jgi:hypothetical protein